MGAFTGKTVLILGGSRGIGAAIVRRFVTDGANVRFTYAGSKDAAKRPAQETGATAVFTDSADRDAVIDVVRKSGRIGYPGGKCRYWRLWRGPGIKCRRY